LHYTVFPNIKYLTVPTAGIVLFATLLDMYVIAADTMLNVPTSEAVEAVVKLDVVPSPQFITVFTVYGDVDVEEFGVGVQYMLTV